MQPQKEGLQSNKNIDQCPVIVVAGQGMPPEIDTEQSPGKRKLCDIIDDSRNGKLVLLVDVGCEVVYK
jgi:hypothetical protein